MPNSSAPRTVGDYVSLQRGSTYKGDLVGTDGPPLLGLGSIEPGGGFRRGHFKTFGGDCPEKWMVPPGSIYVALKGATKDGSMVGSVARLPLDLPAGRLTQDTARLIFRDPRPEIAQYLYWLLRTPQYRAYCAGRITGSASASFSREDFLSFAVPPLTERSLAVVRALESAETKVDQNRLTSTGLERLARAIFRAWFVDFDAVKAKAAGATGFPSVPQEVFDVLPTHRVDSEVGPVPEGWQVKSLSKSITFRNGLALQKFPPRGDGADLPVIKIAELRKSSTDGADRANADVPTAYLVDDGDLLSLGPEHWKLSSGLAAAAH
jgi:type I restriction enzyme S subunit